MCIPETKWRERSSAKKNDSPSKACSAKQPLKLSLLFLFSTSVAAFFTLLSAHLWADCLGSRGFQSWPRRHAPSPAAEAPRPLGNARIHSDKDLTCWRGLRETRLAADDWTDHHGRPAGSQFRTKAQSACPDWALEPEMSTPSLHSLIRSFQPVLLMFVLCYSRIETFFWGEEMLPGSKIFLLYTVLSKSVKWFWFFSFFPLSLKHFFVAWMMKDTVFTQQLHISPWVTVFISDRVEDNK